MADAGSILDSRQVLSVNATVDVCHHRLLKMLQLRGVFTAESFEIVDRTGLCLLQEEVFDDSLGRQTGSL